MVGAQHVTLTRRYLLGFAQLLPWFSRAVGPLGRLRMYTLWTYYCCTAHAENSLQERAIDMFINY